MTGRDDDVEDADADALVGYEDHDDVDSIASTMRERARLEREVSAEGVLRMLTRPAYYEVNAAARR